MLCTTVMIPSLPAPLMEVMRVQLYIREKNFIYLFEVGPIFFSIRIRALYILFVHEGQGDRVRVIQTLLFVSGINTLLQALFGTSLPTVVGGSFAYVLPILYIISDPYKISKKKFFNQCEQFKEL